MYLLVTCTGKQAHERIPSTPGTHTGGAQLSPENKVGPIGIFLSLQHPECLY